jgi:hypothetical protein
MNAHRLNWLLHITLIILGMPAAVYLGSFSIRVLGLQWVGPLLITVWFLYFVWFIVHGVWRGRRAAR